MHATRQKSLQPELRQLVLDPLQHQDTMGVCLIVFDTFYRPAKSADSGLQRGKHGKAGHVGQDGEIVGRNKKRMCTCCPAQALGEPAPGKVSR